MTKPLSCPQCGASDANLLQDNLYQCKFCGSVYEFGNAKSDTKDKANKNYQTIVIDSTSVGKTSRKIITPFLFILAGISISISLTIYFVSNNALKKFKSDTSYISSKGLYNSLNESTYSFAAVNTKKEPQVWTISKIISERNTKVEYFLNQVDVNQRKVIKSKIISHPITFTKSIEDAYRMNQPKPIGNICWIIYGEQLFGYDVNTFEEIANNTTLSNKFTELKKGISKVEDVFNVPAIKLTTKDGYEFYFLPEQNKLFNEKDYNNINKNRNDLSLITEFYFTEDERQQLYKLERNVSNILYTKIPSSTINSLVSENDNWYKKNYHVKSIQELTPNLLYFNASVLYSDSSKVVIVYQKELGESSAFLLSCLDINGKEIWTNNSIDVEILKLFKKTTISNAYSHGSQLVITQPYLVSINIDISDGKLKWIFKPY